MYSFEIFIEALRSFDISNPSDKFILDHLCISSLELFEIWYEKYPYFEETTNLIEKR